MGNVDDQVEAHVTKEVTSTCWCYAYTVHCTKQRQKTNHLATNELTTARPEVLEAKSSIMELREEAASLTGTNSKL